MVDRVMQSPARLVLRGKQPSCDAPWRGRLASAARCSMPAGEERRCDPMGERSC